MRFLAENRIKETKVLAIIPARGGSKGIPRKNIRALCGKPLIAYTIEVALRAKLIDRVVVSTEDEEIAEISKCYGAEVPFLRPSEMAQDRSNLGDVTNFTLNELKKEDYQPDTVVTLFTTHPFRSPELVDFLVKKNLEGYSSVKTVKLINHTRKSVFARNGANRIKPLLSHSQENGAADGCSFYRVYGLYQGINYRCFEKPYIHVVGDQVSLVDIDTFADFYLAEEIIKNNIFEFEIK